MAAVLMVVVCACWPSGAGEQDAVSPLGGSGASRAAHLDVPPGTVAVEGSGVVLEQVAELRGLAVPERSVIVSAAPPPTPGELLLRLITGQTALGSRELATDESLFVTLGLVDGDVDLAAGHAALVRQRRGWASLVLVVMAADAADVADGEPLPVEVLSGEEQAVLAHELVHVLQATALPTPGPLASWSLGDGLVDDAYLASRALVEGDAVVTQRDWSAAHQQRPHPGAQSPAPSAGPQRCAPRPMFEVDGAPPFLAELFAFPYRAGPELVCALQAAGGRARVDEAFADPPVSTEQVLHPSKYLEDERPQTLPALEGPGPQWTRERKFVLGELLLRHLLTPLGEQRARRAAAGWGGGVMSVWSHQAEPARTLVTASVAFDTAADLDDGCATLTQWATRRPGLPPGVRAQVHCTDDTVYLAVGPAPDVKATLASTQRVAAKSTGWSLIGCTEAVVMRGSVVGASRP